MQFCFPVKSYLRKQQKYYFIKLKIIITEFVFIIFGTLLKRQIITLINIIILCCCYKYINQQVMRELSREL